MDETITYLPASGHGLWAGSYDHADLEILDDLDDLISVEPVVGWAVIRHEEGDVMPYPLTPNGVLVRGISRILGEDREAVSEAIRASAVDVLTRRKAAKAGQAGEPVAF